MKPKLIDELLTNLIEAIDRDNNPSMSVEEAAKLLGQDKECLRRSIAAGTCPFGYGGTGPGGNRYGRVSKLALWNWIMKGVA